MKISFNIEYTTVWGEHIYVCGSIPELGAWDESDALLLEYKDVSCWGTQIQVGNVEAFDYYYCIKKDGVVVRKEYGKPRVVTVDGVDSILLMDSWIDKPKQDFLYTSAFADSFFKHKEQKKQKLFKHSIVINVDCPYVEKDQELLLVGESDLLGSWAVEKAIRLKHIDGGVWQTILEASSVSRPLEYKLAIYNTHSKKVVYWENDGNRVLQCLSESDNSNLRQEQIFFRHNPINWKAAGVAIPVFSLRSETGFGVGEFPDLKRMIDWAVTTGQKVIQVLPVNDTTISHTWSDSYPYNAISIYALHPLYLGLSGYPLQDKKLANRYAKQAEKLNALAAVDYEKVMELKRAYISDLFDEIGERVLSEDGFKSFFEKNNEWLFPYACFSCLRDKFNTASYSRWNSFSAYNRPKLEALLKADVNARKAVEQSYFVQYLLHVQLSDVKKYAHQKGVVLKGDIPIGINRDSVEAWVEPHLFNLDSQTGAPPDDFSVTGQNWGFPTYNWQEMAKDGYLWWKKRFAKMADYFDAYRIDHILGFFRIWEIPLHSVEGLLGYFSPALPLSVSEIENYGFVFDEQRMTVPCACESHIHDLFAEYTQEVVAEFLYFVGNQQYSLKEHCDTQVKIKALFEGKEDYKSIVLRNGLFSLCNEVLFVRDKQEPDKFHPRISAYNSSAFACLDQYSKDAYNRLYDDFFYHRHNEFWKEQAMQKLPALISSTRMLVCGEDLGMIPQSVPVVMNELQILSLEIQRMPKQYGVQFEDLDRIPYLSVCTTSTHDMSPLRMWWKENKLLTQQYYNNVLGLHGDAPEDCGSDVCDLIVSKHLASSAMFVILPLQDWLSVDEGLRNPNVDDERINIPSVPKHYWKYRMHVSLEKLLKAKKTNQYIKTMVIKSGR